MQNDTPIEAINLTPLKMLHAKRLSEQKNKKFKAPNDWSQTRFFNLQLHAIELFVAHENAKIKEELKPGLDADIEQLEEKGDTCTNEPNNQAKNLKRRAQEIKAMFFSTTSPYFATVYECNSKDNGINKQENIREIKKRRVDFKQELDSFEAEYTEFLKNMRSI